MNQSDALKVKEFTEGTSAVKCPNEPKVMTQSSVMFIIRMVMSEMCELACTVCDNEEDRDNLLKEALESRDKCHNFNYTTENEVIAAQFDAMVDSWYYCLNLAAKHGVNLSSIFNLVHEANMNKRDPVTGQFLKRESDGKIIKPDGWKSPDIEAEILRQKTDGAW